MSAGNENIEQIRVSVKDYCGYKQSDDRLNSDKKLRIYWIKQLKSLGLQLQNIPIISNKEDQQMLEKLQGNTRRKLTTILDSLKYNIQPQARFYSQKSLTERVLTKLYMLELSMILGLKNLQEEIDLLHKEQNIDDYQEHFILISNYIDSFNQNLFEREALIIDDPLF